MGWTKETRPESPPPPSTKGKVAVPKVLGRFRAVVTQTPKADAAAHKPLRKLLEENPKEFFAQLNRMEDDHARRVAEREKEQARALPEEAEGGPAADAGLEAVDEMITKLLGEWDAALPGTDGKK